MDEEYWMVQLHVKATVNSLLKQYVREKNQTKQVTEIATLCDEIINDKTKIDQTLWIKIIDRMYEDKDVQVLKHRILEKAHFRNLADL